jgi:hypothetical protein
MYENVSQDVYVANGVTKEDYKEFVLSPFTLWKQRTLFTNIGGCGVITHKGVGKFIACDIGAQLYSR